MLYTTRLYRKVTIGSVQRKPVYLKTSSRPNLKSNLTATYTVTFRHHSSLGNFFNTDKENQIDLNLVFSFAGTPGWIMQ
jgi:hypothetical protein